jgi:transcriptional regulator with XRE-family HTH domain
MINAAQIRAARGLLKWTQSTLAANSALSVVTLNMIESETVQPRKTSLGAIKKALEAGGVEFLGAQDGGGVGVRLRASCAPLHNAPVSSTTHPPANTTKNLSERDDGGRDDQRKSRDRRQNGVAGG